MPAMWRGHDGHHHDEDQGSKGRGTVRTVPRTMAATTSPPTTLAAAFSGWPSKRAATDSGSSEPAAAAAAAASAADEPSPRATGIWDRTVMASRSWPATSMAVRAARCPASSDSSAPSPSLRTTKRRSRLHLDLDVALDREGPRHRNPGPGSRWRREPGPARRQNRRSASEAVGSRPVQPSRSDAPFGAGLDHPDPDLGPSARACFGALSQVDSDARRGACPPRAPRRRALRRPRLRCPAIFVGFDRLGGSDHLFFQCLICRISGGSLFPPVIWRDGLFGIERNRLDSVCRCRGLDGWKSGMVDLCNHCLYRDCAGFYFAFLQCFVCPDSAA